MREAIFRLRDHTGEALNALREVSAFVLVCGALFGGMYLAAGTYGAARSTYTSAMNAMLDPPHGDSSSKSIANFCDARINWMTINGPSGFQARGQIYSFLDQACPGARDTIQALRHTKPA